MVAYELAGLKIVGISGIYKSNLFSQAKRASVTDFDKHSNKEYISFIESEVEQAIDYDSADILLLHDWASDIISAEALKLFQQRYSNARYQSIGNEYARLLIEALKPKLVLCGHLHFKYRHVRSRKEQTPINICCLANVQSGKDALAVFRLTPELEIFEVT